MRFIGSLGYSRVILKGNEESSMRMLLEVLQQARLRLGFYVNIEISGPADSQANGRVERERDSDGERYGEDIGSRCQRMRRVGWLLTHYRRQGGGPTDYEIRTGRKYCGKIAVFGERMLASQRK